MMCFKLGVVLQFLKINHVLEDTQEDRSQKAHEHSPLQHAT